VLHIYEHNIEKSAYTARICSIIANMNHWTELRTALAVAKLGTVQAAAELLGVHRATVNRHIETLESELGVPLFQRHAKGYTLTDVGHDMMEVANRADELFKDFAGRSSSSIEKLSGTLKISSLAVVAPLLVPVIDEFHQSHSEIQLEFIADEQLARLEHGEAHIAIRAGDKPTTPDYVVLPFRKVCFGIYASKNYIKKEGKPSQDNLTKHKFVGPQGSTSPLPYAAWLDSEIPEGSFVMRTTNQHVVTAAIRQGLGIGFIAENDAHASELVEIIAPDDMWSTNLWIVTHVDLRRTLKVQEFLKFARA